MLEKTKDKVLKEADKRNDLPAEARENFLLRAAGKELLFFNTSPMDLFKLGSKDIKRNLLKYVDSFSKDAREAKMAELFQTSPQNITLHLKAIYDEDELSEAATCKDYLQVQSEGNRSISRQIKHYRLDAVPAVGFRVRSHRGTQFRRWANERLREYLVKGFTMDDERLKNPGSPGAERTFEELLARIRDIRSSEKGFWRKVLDIYATSVDYDPSSEASQRFFKTVQNKMHWAAHGYTAAEVVALRADSSQPNLGLWNELVRRPIQEDPPAQRPGEQQTGAAALVQARRPGALRGQPVRGVHDGAAGGQRHSLLAVHALGTLKGDLVTFTRQHEFLSQIISRLNELFITDGLTDKDVVNYAYTLRDKISENQAVMKQIENNSPEQAMLGDFATALDDAVMESSEVHQNLMNQVLTNKETAAGLSRVVFDMLLAMKKGLGVERHTPVPPSSR